MEVTSIVKRTKVTQIRSMYADGSKVWIDIRPIDERTSKIELRVGAKGNKEASVKLLDRIKSYL